MRMRIGFVALLLAAFSAAGAPQAKAPSDPKVIDAQGYQKIVQQHRGKPLLMTFWATWCEPCRDEYPMLNELAKQYGPKGLQVVGVDFDDEGDLILMRRFIARYKPIFPNYRKQQGGEAEFKQAVWPEWNDDAVGAKRGGLVSQLLHRDLSGCFPHCAVSDELAGDDPGP